MLDLPWIFIIFLIGGRNYLQKLSIEPVKPTLEQLENLIALRREERLQQGEWRDFLSELRERQEDRSGDDPAASGVPGRVKIWFRDLGPSKWAYGAGLAYAILTIAYLLAHQKPGGSDEILVPVKHGGLPATMNRSGQPHGVVPPVRMLAE